MEKITLTPIAFVSNARRNPEDDHWANVISQIKLVDEIPEWALDGIDDFSHAEIIFYFHQVHPEKAIPQLRHPRNNTDWKKVGSFAQRNKARPNQLGLTTVEVLKREKNILFVKNLDAIDGTPILDIKPVMQEFLPKKNIQQPDWATELMRNYW